MMTSNSVTTPNAWSMRCCQLSPGDVVAILKDRELLASLHAYLSAEALAELAELTIVMLVVEADVAHECSRTVDTTATPYSSTGPCQRGRSAYDSRGKQQSMIGRAGET